MPNSRRKGHQFERDVAKFYAAVYGDARRGQQSREGYDEPDVVIPHCRERFWVECKRRESMAIYKWWEQAEKAAGMMEPVVHIRADKKPPLVVIDQDHWGWIIGKLRDLRDGVIISRVERLKPRQTGEARWRGLTNW